MRGSPIWEMIVSQPTDRFPEFYVKQGIPPENIFRYKRE